MQSLIIDRLNRDPFVDKTWDEPQMSKNSNQKGSVEVELEGGCGSAWALAWEQALLIGNYVVVWRGSQNGIMV